MTSKKSKQHDSRIVDQKTRAFKMSAPRTDRFLCGNRRIGSNPILWFLVQIRIPMKRLCGYNLSNAGKASASANMLRRFVWLLATSEATAQWIWIITAARVTADETARSCQIRQRGRRGLFALYPIKRLYNFFSSMGFVGRPVPVSFTSYRNLFNVSIPFSTSNWAPVRSNSSALPSQIGQSACFILVAPACTQHHSNVDPECQHLWTAIALYQNIRIILRRSCGAL